MAMINGLEGSPMSQLLAQQFISKADTDSNGEISKDEFIDVLKGIASSNKIDVENVFSKVDTNGDGSISLDELSSYLETNKPKHLPPPPPDILNMLFGQANNNNAAQGAGNAVDVAA